MQINARLRLFALEAFLILTGTCLIQVPMKGLGSLLVAVGVLFMLWDALED